MDRRRFVGSVAGALLAASIDAGAQQPGKLLRVIGCLNLSWIGAGISSILYPLRVRLVELGWIEGRNLAIVARAAEDKPERLPELAAELVALGPEVIVAFGTPATLAAKKATVRIPIVMAGTNNPVADGLVASLAKPGGNVTGLANNPGPAFYQKMLQLLKDAAPNISRVAVLRNTDDARDLAHIEAAAPAVKLTVIDADVRTGEQMKGALDSALRAGANALYVFPDYVNNSQTFLIVDFARSNRLPTIGADRFFVEAGGLLSYWTDWSELRRRAANYVDRILRGADPGVLAVEQPDTFELLINLKTADEIGIAIPKHLLAQANHVIR